MQPLAGKAILITGAARRLGAATARRLHALGAAVAIHHRGSAAEAQALAAELNAKRPGSAGVLALDLADIDAYPDLIERVLRLYGRLDGLVNNASTFMPRRWGASPRRSGRN